MARTKQTPRQGARRGKMAKATFTVPADATAGGPTPSMSAASASAPTTSISADDGENVPRPRHKDAAE